MSPPCHDVCTICSQPPCRILISIYYIWRCSRLTIQKAPCPNPAYLPASPYPRKGTASTIAVDRFSGSLFRPRSLYVKNPIRYNPRFHIFGCTPKTITLQEAT